MRQNFCQMYPWQHLLMERTCHRKTPNKKLLNQIPTAQGLGNAWKHGPGFGFTNLVGVCHWSRESHWYYILFCGIKWFLPFDQGEDDTGCWAEVDGVIYYHQTMNQLDVWRFAWALLKEVNGHVDNGGYGLIPCSKVPEGVEPIPSLLAICS